MGFRQNRALGKTILPQSTTHRPVQVIGLSERPRPQRRKTTDCIEDAIMAYKSLETEGIVVTCSLSDQLRIRYAPAYH